MGSDRLVVNIGTLLFVTIVFVSTLVPFRAEASFLCNDFVKISCSEVVNAEDEDLPQKNVALLQATISPNQNSTSTKDEVVIIDGTSLLPESQKPADAKTIGEDQISLYVVHKGDTLPDIAKMFGVSVNTIRWGNDIKGNTVTEGQTLVILPISGVQHTVRSGDTIQGITKLYKGDYDEVLQYNNLTKLSKLAIGDIIVVPDGEIPVVSSVSAKKVGPGSKQTSYPSYQGYYLRPIVGGIKTQGLHDRFAVDLASAMGTPILASADGEVLIARGSGWNGGYGSYIVIKHPNGTQTLYGHLSGVLVNAGDHVEQGQVIGKMGNTGRVSGVTGVHLHFEIRGARNPF